MGLWDVDGKTAEILSKQLRSYKRLKVCVETILEDVKGDEERWGWFASNALPKLLEDKVAELNELEKQLKEIKHDRD